MCNSHTSQLNLQQKLKHLLHFTRYLIWTIFNRYISIPKCKGVFSERLRPILSRHYLELRATKLRLQVLFFCDLVVARYKSHQIEKVSEYRKAHTHTHSSKDADAESRIKGCCTQWTSKNHRPQHLPYALSSWTPIRSYNPLFWIHFNTLGFAATHLWDMVIRVEN